jgi:hypothetical protein
MALLHDHGHHSHSHGETSHLSVAASKGNPSHGGHSHGAHAHHAHDHAAPSFRLDAPAWSILRSSLAERLAIAGVLVIAIWVAVIATIWNAA